MLSKYHNNFNEKYRLNYSSTENVESIKDIKNLRVKSALNYLKIDKPIYINTFSDIPAKTGMGSSSAFTVGLLTSLFKLKKKKIDKRKIAELAFKIESKITKNSVGKQDHYIAAYGGFKYIRYAKNKVEVINLNQNKKINKFIKNLIILWTNNIRSSENILEDQKLNKSKNSQDLMAINELTKNFLRTIKSTKSSIIDLFNIIKKNWKIKKNFKKVLLIKLK